LYAQFWEDGGMKRKPASSPTPLAKAIGKRLRTLRNAKRLRPEDLRWQIGLGPDTVRSQESGRREVSRAQALSYAKIYESTPQYILFGAQDDPYIPPGAESVFAPGGFVPVYGPAAGATPERVLFTNDHIVGQDPCPIDLHHVKGAFRMYVQGDSMSPRHEPGEKISVNPHQFPLQGQDCVLILEPDGNAIIKRYLGSTDKEYKLRQFNPAKDFTMKKSEVRAVYAVVKL
jgi:phage repressor protein C with HTH and peptisase S24 domain